MGKTLLVSIKEGNRDWAEEWPGYDDSITEAEAEAESKRVIDSFNKEELRRYGHRGRVRVYLDVLIIDPLQSEPEDELLPPTTKALASI